MLRFTKIVFLLGFATNVYGNKHLLSETQSLTLTTGRMTTSRRSYSISQLACVGGPCRHSPNIIQCTNKGTDGYDIQWECKGEMDEHYKFGILDVVCEGYDYPTDPYILVGSCGLEYTIEYVSVSYPEEVGIYSILSTLIIIFGIGSCCFSDPTHSSNRGWYSGLGTGAVWGSVASRGSYRSYGGRSRMRSGFSGTRRR
tara:strand:+ start:378 stop:974 length:597 start_codon:yes stop_codon:yes gene_type:complete